MILSCQGISKSFGEKVILEDASFHIEEREKAALIGNNGAGKTTLLRIIMNEQHMTILYLIVCGVALIIMDPITGRLGLNGAALGYLILVVLLGVLLMGYILYQIRKDRKRQ